MMRTSLLLLVACLGLGTACAAARPRQIIILRHAEKDADPNRLCPAGELRARALTRQYLGKGATESFYAITGHTIATITPSAQSWGLKVTLPTTDKSRYADKEAFETAQTQDAVTDILTNPAFDGKVVVMTWEHKHIANKALQEGAPDATLRQLLHLDALDASAGGEEKIPKTWSRTNYDFFWIVDFAKPAEAMPTGFRTLKQDFAEPFHDKVPHNDWKDDEPADLVVGCKL